MMPLYDGGTMEGPLCPTCSHLLPVDGRCLLDHIATERRQINVEQYVEWRVLWKQGPRQSYAFINSLYDSGHRSEEDAQRAAERQTNTLAAGWKYRLQARSVHIETHYGSWMDV